MNQVFRIGEKVIALHSNKDSLCQPRIKGRLYKVLDILYCTKCGSQMINIAGKHGDANYIQCCIEQPDFGLWWTLSKHFIRPEDIEEAIEHFAKKDEFETCQVLKQFEEEQLVKIEKQNADKK